VVVGQENTIPTQGSSLQSNRWPRSGRVHRSPRRETHRTAAMSTVRPPTGGPSSYQTGLPMACLRLHQPPGLHPGGASVGVEPGPAVARAMPGWPVNERIGHIERSD
jgi:hypothetical protein